MTMRKTIRLGHREAAMTTASLAHQISQSHVLVKVSHLPQLFVQVQAAEKEAVKKEDDDDEKDHQAWPSGSSDDDGLVSPSDFSESCVG
jgi:hypothetical protein